MESPPTRPTWRRALEVVIPAVLLLLAGMTMLVMGFNDLASGSTIIRDRGKATVVASAVGPLASDFRWHVWTSIAVGTVFIVVAAALLIVVRHGSPAREKLFAVNERSRYGTNTAPSRAARVAAALAVFAITWWLLSN